MQAPAVVGRKVIVELRMPEEVMVGGIFLPQVMAHKPVQGRVIGAWDGSPAKVGDEVLFPKYAGRSVVHEDGTIWVFLQEREVLGVIERQA